MATDVNIILKDLSKNLNILVKQAWIASGLKPNAEILKTIESKVDNNNQLSIYAAEYAKYIDSGRKKRAKKIPISALIQFIKKNSISADISINKLAFMIQNAIYLNGIQAKNIIDQGKTPIINFSTKELTTKIQSLIEQEINSTKRY